MALKMMRVRDAHASISNDESVIEMPSGGLDIIADDGRTLLTITMRDDGGVEVSGNSFCKHQDVMLDSALMITPRACNAIHINRKPYESDIEDK